MSTEQRSRPILTFCICAITERAEMAMKLVDYVESLADGENVQVLVLMDNKKTTVGEKRNQIKSVVMGQYWVQIDDDDNVHPSFFREVLPILKEGKVDVLTYNSHVSLVSKEGISEGLVVSKQGNEIEQFKPNRVTQRPPAQFNVWNTDKFKDVMFQPINYGEDLAFGKEASHLVEVSHYIDKTLHYYQWDYNVTRAV